MTPERMAEQLSDILANDMLVLSRNSNHAAVQTANESRAVHTASMGVLGKRIAEYDPAEAAAGFSATAHTNRMAVTSAAGADSAQIAQSALQLNHITSQLSQLLTKVG